MSTVPVLSVVSISAGACACTGPATVWACNCQPTCDCSGTGGTPATLAEYDVKTNSTVIATVEYDSCNLVEVYVSHDGINTDELVFDLTLGGGVSRRTCVFPAVEQVSQMSPHNRRHDGSGAWDSRWSSKRI
jgi:hypothetical protein